MDRGPYVVPSGLVRTERRGSGHAVLTHEGSTKEFKENFTWGSLGEYVRTMAAFANARGGHIIFGVTDRPRVAVGLTEKAARSLDELDRAKLTQSLNELFSPELEWEIGFAQIGKAVRLGVIYTYECGNKPVVARKTIGSHNARILEGDILYRYNSRTERIKYSELRAILDEAKAREGRAMLRHIEGLVRAGASNAAILDFSTSTLTGHTGQRVLLDEELINKIKFIREGEFHEVRGAPALKVVGSVTPAATIAIGPERVVRTALSSDDVLGDFLMQASITNPEQYLRQAASGPTSFLPVQYYRRAAHLSSSELVGLISGVVTRSPARGKILQRLLDEDTMLSLPPSSSTQHASTVARKQFYDELVAGHVNPSIVDDEAHARYFLDAVRCLQDLEIRRVASHLFPVLRVCFERYYDKRPGNVADSLRRAACRMDVALFSENL